MNLNNLAGVPLLLGLLISPLAAAEPKPRARDLGIPFQGVPGPLNAITDVPGVEVGHTTLIEGDGPLVKGKGPIRTGVTAILPRGRQFDPVYAATYALNGNGEMTGIHWIKESGYLETPLMITNTFSVGVVRDAVIAWMDMNRINADPDGGRWYTYPVVAETYDRLNDILGQHVTKEHTFAALDQAKGGPVAEGNVGGGTGMIAFSFKAGIGTASRLLATGHTLGVLVQANFGTRSRFTVAGVPVGSEIHDLLPLPPRDDRSRGSVIVVVATDAPLVPQQLQRLTQRVPLAIGRLGGLGENGSGDIFIAFSTGNPGAWHKTPKQDIKLLSNSAMDDMFAATVQATEEAVVNSMVAAEDMTGRNGITAYALPHDRLQQILKKYARWVEPESLPHVVSMSVEDLQRLAGRYVGNGRPPDARLFVDGGMLFIEYWAGCYRLIPIGTGRFLNAARDYEVRFSSDDLTRIQVVKDGEIIGELERTP